MPSFSATGAISGMTMNESSKKSRKNARKKIYADFSAWRRDANLWFRFTEAGFDDFMQSQKL